jgi:hypothetical protein
MRQQQPNRAEPVAGRTLVSEEQLSIFPCKIRPIANIEAGDARTKRHGGRFFADVYRYGAESRAV